MKRQRRFALLQEMEFRNVSESQLHLDDVFERIASFMETDPRRTYDLFIGTDAQVHSGHTKFITSITIHRFYVDIDAGTDELKNKTAAYVSEMVGRVEAMGLSARIKPEAVGASAVSNRYTKTPFRRALIRAAT